MQKLKGKRGFAVIQLIPGIIIALVVVAMVSGLGGLVLSKMAGISGIDANVASALNVSATTILGINTTWLSIIITVAMAVVLILMIFLVYQIRKGGRE